MIEEYTEEKYPMLKEWWEGHGWNPVPETILPKLGVIAIVNKEPLAAGFMYMDNSVGVAVLEWVVTDPKGNPIRVYKALKQMEEFLCSRVKELDYGVVLTSCKQESLVKFYEKADFVKTDTNLTHLVKVL